MTALRMLVAVGVLLAIMGIAVVVLLGRAGLLCVQWVGRKTSATHTLPEPIPIRCSGPETPRRAQGRRFDVWD